MENDYITTPHKLSSVIELKRVNIIVSFYTTHNGYNKLLSSKNTIMNNTESKLCDSKSCSLFKCNM